MELPLALSALSQGFSVIKVAIAARDEAKLTAALNDMTERLSTALIAGLEAASTAASLQAQLAAVEREKAELHRRLEERLNYVLHEIRPGAFTYVPNLPANGVQPAHHLCQVCFDAGVKVVLQQTLSGDTMKCPSNGSHNIGLRSQTWNPLPRTVGPWSV